MSVKLDKIRQVIPEMDFAKMSHIIQKFVVSLINNDEQTE